MNFVKWLLSLLGKGKQAQAPPAPAPVPPPRVAPYWGGFDRALSFTLKWEGGRVDDPADHGGRTNKGITQRTYDTWNDAKGVPHADVWDITDCEVSNIYRNEYWLGGHCDKLDWPLALVHFDTCVMFGPARAIPIFLENTTNPFDYINMRRLYHHKRAEQDRSQYKFLAGWLNRCDALEKEARG